MMCVPESVISCFVVQMGKATCHDEVISFLQALIEGYSLYVSARKGGKKHADGVEYVLKKSKIKVEFKWESLLEKLRREYREVLKDQSKSGAETRVPVLRGEEQLFEKFHEFMELYYKEGSSAAPNLLMNPRRSIHPISGRHPSGESSSTDTYLSQVSTDIPSTSSAPTPDPHHSSPTSVASCSSDGFLVDTPTPPLCSPKEGADEGLMSMAELERIAIQKRITAEEEKIKAYIRL